MTSVHESSRLRRVCLVCSYERARLTVIVVSARGELAEGWRFVSRARACRLRRPWLEWPAAVEEEFRFRYVRLLTPNGVGHRVGVWIAGERISTGNCRDNPDAGVGHQICQAIRCVGSVTFRARRGSRRRVKRSPGSSLARYDRNGFHGH